MCRTINEFRQTDLLNLYHKDPYTRAFIHATVGLSDMVFTGGFLHDKIFQMKPTPLSLRIASSKIWKKFEEVELLDVKCLLPHCKVFGFLSHSQSSFLHCFYRLNRLSREVCGGWGLPKPAMQPVHRADFHWYIYPRFIAIWIWGL